MPLPDDSVAATGPPPAGEWEQPEPRVDSRRVARPAQSRAGAIGSPRPRDPGDAKPGATFGRRDRGRLGTDRRGREGTSPPRT